MQLYVAALDPHRAVLIALLGCWCTRGWGTIKLPPVATIWPDQLPLKRLPWLLVQVRLHHRLGHLADIYDGLHPGRSWFSQLSLTPRGSFS